MRKRNVHIQFWLDEKEAENFNRNVKRSGLSREAYLRQLINGLVPRDAPPPDYYAMRRELFRIGNNLNQLAAMSHARGWPQAQRLDKALAELNETNRELLNRQLPQNIGTDVIMERGRRVEKEKV